MGLATSAAVRANAFEERAALLLALRQSGVRDISVMRAIENVPRDAFAPYRFRDLANRNMALPIGCGQTMSRPADLARRIEALRPGRGHRVLEVGTGSGYGTAALAYLAREVLSLERFETLAIEAARRLAALNIANARALHEDGLKPSRAHGEFDRILLHAAVAGTPMALVQLLAPNGALVFGRIAAPAAQGKPAQARLIRIDHKEGNDFKETDLGPHNFGLAVEGEALAL